MELTNETALRVKRLLSSWELGYSSFKFLQYFLLKLEQVTSGRITSLGLKIVTAD